MGGSKINGCLQITKMGRSKINYGRSKKRRRGNSGDTITDKCFGEGPTSNASISDNREEEGGLSDTHTDEYISDDDTDYDNDDEALKKLERYLEWQKKRFWEEKITEQPEWDVCIKLFPKTRNEQQPLLISRLGMTKLDVDGIHYVHIYGYYRKRRDDGGYGIILRNQSRKPIVAYYGYSKGNSYLYYLLEGMRRGLEIAIERGIAKGFFTINSKRICMYFNNFFSYRPMLSTVCHDDAVICKKCLRSQMTLGREKFKPLFPVIEANIKLQYEIDFKYLLSGGCGEGRSEAAYYVAERGAKKLDKMQQLGASLNELKEVMMEPKSFPKKLNEILKRDEKLLSIYALDLN